MARFRLEALAPRRYCLGRGSNGELQWAAFTEEDCQAQAAKIKRMLRAGVPIPVSWEHREDQRPRRLSRDDWHSEQAKGTAGWLDGLEFDKATNILFPIVEIPDAADAKRAEALRFCSPEFRPDVVDGYGGEWGYAMTHLALTPKPRHQGQQPIQRLSAAVPVAGTLSGAIRLSVDPRTGADMADEPKDKKEPPADDKPPKKGEKGDAPETPEGGDQPEDGAEGSLGTIIQALREGGMNIPPEVIDVAGLVIAIKAVTGAGTAANSLTDPNNPPEEVQPGGGNGGAPIMMSTTEKALAEKVAKRDEKTIGREKTDLVRRLDALAASGRATPAEVKSRKAELETIRLSVSDDGEVGGHAKLIGWIEGREDIKPGSGFSLTNKDNPEAVRLSNATTDPPPDDTTKAMEKVKDDAKREAKRVSV